MQDGKTPAPRRRPRQQAANENSPVDQDALSIDDLARGVIAREFRPRVLSIRRLAEAVLAGTDAPGTKARQKKKKDKTRTKAGRKKRKLAMIPQQNGS